MHTYMPLTAISTLALAALLAGCGSKDADPPAETNSGTTAEAPAPSDSGADPREADYLDGGAGAEQTLAANSAASVVAA